MFKTDEYNDSKRNSKHCIQISEVKEDEDLFKMLKLQHFGHLMQRVDSLEKTLMLGKIEGRRRSEQQRMRWLNGIIDSLEFEQILRDSEGQRSLVGCSLWGCKESDTTE